MSRRFFLGGGGGGGVGGYVLIPIYTITQRFQLNLCIYFDS